MGAHKASHNQDNIPTYYVGTHGWSMLALAVTQVQVPIKGR